MQETLSRSQWLAGEHFSLADINTVPFVHRMETLDGFDLANWPAVVRWLHELIERPAFAVARFVEQGEPKPEGA